MLDTAVFLYAEGGRHRYRDPCRRVVELVSSGRLAAEASVGVIQEYANVRLRRGGERADALERAGWLKGVCRLHGFRVEDLSLALGLLADHERLGPQDAVYAATALNRGIEAIVTTDRDFDGIAALERIDPLDSSRIDELARP